MSTSLDIYPFHKVPKGAACAAIAKYFSKLTGLADVRVDIAIHNEGGNGKMRWLSENECIAHLKNVWFSAWEQNHVKAGATIDIIDADLIVQNPCKYASPLMSVSDIRLKRTSMLLLQLSAAMGMAHAMGNGYVLHSGEFGWVVGLHKMSPYTAGNDELLREGYANEFDIPLGLIENIYSREKNDTIEQAVFSFFADKYEVD